MRLQRIMLLFLVSLALLAYLFASTHGATAETPPGNPNPPSSFLCPPIEGELYNELWPNSGLLPGEDGRWAVNNGDWVVTPGQVVQQDSTPGQLNLAYEITTDIADGIIYGCMQIPDLPPGTADFPHGFIFRTDGVANGFGVGFLNHNTLALGRMVNGTPQAIVILPGNYDAEALNRFKIVLDRNPNSAGGRIRVYVAEANNPFPPVPDLYVTGPIVDNFRVGKVGMGTYGVAAVFASLHVDFDCTTFTGTNQLSHVGQAVYQTLAAFEDHKTFCGHQNHGELIRLPSIEGNPNHDPNHPHQSAFIRYADLIATAKYEVAFTTMLWDMPLSTTHPVTGTRSAGPLALLGRDPATGIEPSPEEFNGLEKLYNNVKTSPENYPYGMKIWILLGLDHRPSVLQTLKAADIPLCEPIPDCSDWRIEVVYHRKGIEWSASHSHVKLLVVDRQEAIVGGYNVNNWYANGTYDLGVGISGPAAFAAMRKFQALWLDAGKGLCEPGVDDLSIIPIQQCQEFDPGPVGIAEGEYAPLATAIKLRDENRSAFTMFRHLGEPASDAAILSAIGVANQEINVWHERMAQTSLFTTAPYILALYEAIEANENNEDFKVNLLLKQPNTRDPQGLWEFTVTRRGVYALNTLVGSELAHHLDVRLFAAGPPGYRMHTKSLSIDNQFVIIGSQNWDFSAWYFGIWNLAEMNFGLDDEAAAAEYNQMFMTFWNDEDIARPPCEVFPGTNWHGPLFDCLGASVNSAQATTSEDPDAPFAWLEEGVYAGSNLLLDQPAALVGLGPETILEPEPDTPAGIPLIHITSSDVSLVGLTFRNSTGYAIEIGDGVTPVENIFISHSIFENNTYGGIKINGPASVYYVENNTFVGGEAGIVINVSGTAAEKAIVRNNIFSEQTDAPVRVDSANDGGVSYSYNLFDNCIRAENGVCPENWLIGAMHPNSVEQYNLINTPPNFNDPANGDYSLTYPSAAIDAGDPETTSPLDADGIGDGIVRADMGAIPFVPDPELWQLVPTAPQPGEMAIITTTVPVTFTWQWLDETLPAPGSYQFQLAADAQFLNLIANTQVTTTTHTVFGLGDVYYWRVGHGTPTTWAQVRQLNVPNNAPVAVNDSAYADTGYSMVIHVLNNDYDPDGDLLSVISITQPGYGSVTLNLDNTVTYHAPTRPLGGNILITNFTYTISDGRGGTDTALVTVTVQDPPCICPPPDW